jgi:hypothetical protein
MQSGFFHRAMVAIVLIGTLLMPVGICLPHTHAHMAGHDCCDPAPEHTAQTDCCVVHNPLSAIVVAPDLPGPAPLAVAQGFISSNELSSPAVFSDAVFIPPQSPPTGAFNLRI